MQSSSVTATRKNVLSTRIGYIELLLLAVWVDVNLVLGIKAIYFFALPFLIMTVIRIGLCGREAWSKPDKYLMLWFVSYFFAAGHIVSTEDFVYVVFGQIVLFLLYFGFKLVLTPKNIKTLEKWLMLGCVFVSVLGIVQLGLYYTIGSTWGISHVTHGVGLPRPASLTAEPDWYGLVCMVGALYFVVQRFAGKTIFGKKIDIVALGFCLLGLCLSLVRAAWVGFVAAVIVYYFITSARKDRTNSLTIIIPAFCIVLCAGLAISLVQPEIIDKILTRMDISNWTNTAVDGGAANSRQSAIDVMLHYVELHPLTGNGVGSMNAIAKDTDLLQSLGVYHQINSGRGNANIVITNLFDVGVIGTLFLVAFFVSYFRSLYRAFKETGDVSIVFFLIVVVGLLVDFQFNNGLRLAYVWVLMSFGMSYCRFAAASQEKD